MNEPHDNLDTAHNPTEGTMAETDRPTRTLTNRKRSVEIRGSAQTCLTWWTNAESRIYAAPIRVQAIFRRLMASDPSITFTTEAMARDFMQWGGEVDGWDEGPLVLIFPKPPDLDLGLKVAANIEQGQGEAERENTVRERWTEAVRSASGADRQGQVEAFNSVVPAGSTVRFTFPGTAQEGIGVTDSPAWCGPAGAQVRVVVGGLALPVQLGTVALVDPSAEPPRIEVVTRVVPGKDPTRIVTHHPAFSVPDNNTEKLSTGYPQTANGSPAVGQVPLTPVVTGETPPAPRPRQTADVRSPRTPDAREVEAWTELAFTSVDEQHRAVVARMVPGPLGGLTLLLFSADGREVVWCSGDQPTVADALHLLRVRVRGEVVVAQMRLLDLQRLEQSAPERAAYEYDDHELPSLDLGDEVTP